MMNSLNAIKDYWLEQWYVHHQATVLIAFQSNIINHYLIAVKLHGLSVHNYKSQVIPDTKLILVNTPLIKNEAKISQRRVMTSCDFDIMSLTNHQSVWAVNHDVSPCFYKTYKIKCRPDHQCDKNDLKWWKPFFVSLTPFDVLVWSMLTWRRQGLWPILQQATRGLSRFLGFTLGRCPSLVTV